MGCTGDSTVDWSEYDTDLDALATIASAHQRLAIQNDDFGYYIVFKKQGVPGYVLT